MNRRKSHNIKNQESISWHDSWNEKDMLFNDSDAALFESVGGYIKGMNDLEEVRMILIWRQQIQLLSK